MLAPGKYKEAQFTVFDGLTAKKEQGKGWLYTTRRKPGEQVDIS